LQPAIPLQLLDLQRIKENLQKMEGKGKGKRKRINKNGHYKK
jgi:hypothetical protein